MRILSRRLIRWRVYSTRCREVEADIVRRIEALHGDRSGQYRIRINDQWRLCFVWRDGHAWEVEIVDYY